MHSGDLCYIDEDGELFVIDRLKELIKYRGHQISPGEIEEVLMSHPTILEVAVVAVPHLTDDEHPIAYATKKPDVKVLLFFNVHRKLLLKNIEFDRIYKLLLLILTRIRQSMLHHSNQIAFLAGNGARTDRLRGEQYDGPF